MTERRRRILGVVRIGKYFLGIPILSLSEVFRIDAIHAFAGTGPFVTGAVSLRNNLIPLIDISALCGIEDHPTSRHLGVVVTHNDRAFAFCIDEIVEMTRIRETSVSALNQRDVQTAQALVAIVLHGTQLVSLLDIKHIFSIQDLLTAPYKRSTDDQRVQKDAKPVLSFVAGSAVFSVPAVDVYAAVPKQPITSTSLTGGPCLGEISYHGRRIPIVCAVSIFGLGEPRRDSLSEIVVLRFDDDAVLGFAVDAISDIRTLDKPVIQNLPFWQGTNTYVQDVQVLSDRSQIFAINVAALRESDDLKNLAKITLETDHRDDMRSKKMGSGLSQRIVYEQKRYIVISAGGTCAIPLSEVVNIIDYPTDLAPAHVQMKGFKGFFVHAQESVALVNLVEKLGRSSVGDADARVLLTGTPKNRIGYVVDRVMSIQQSNWREQHVSDTSPLGPPLVELEQGQTRVILPILHLTSTEAYPELAADTQV